MWKSNQNAWILTHLLNINFFFNVSLFNVCTASATQHCLCSNDNMSSAANICCSVTLTDIISFSQVRTAHFSTMNVCNWHLQASCTLKITWWEFMKSTCQINASFHSSSFQWIRKKNVRNAFWDVVIQADNEQELREYTVTIISEMKVVLHSEYNFLVFVEWECNYIKTSMRLMKKWLKYLKFNTELFIVMNNALLKLTILWKGYFEHLSHSIIISQLNWNEGSYAVSYLYKL